MRTETIGSRPTRIVTCTCDRCQKPCDFLAKRCRICERDLCGECGIWDPNPEDSDYPPRYCRECWKAGEPFRKVVEDARRAADEAEAVALNEWRVACPPLTPPPTPKEEVSK